MGIVLRGGPAWLAGQGLGAGDNGNGSDGRRKRGVREREQVRGAVGSGDAGGVRVPRAAGFRGYGGFCGGGGGECEGVGAGEGEIV
ncbi:MAG: hypothetical protein AUJ34_00270 [Parcubacteria group bacterium CG1_02_41_12]|nr:MAG: hypothetical protein AUJ34_00270 [Parcubacteria group bacterium CG1_02_41_12]PIQ80228.1 MAG: hypothetical protein COV79_01575 [Parcubacteria group bacterium CG11_big_fil_rev_8_21_14_0_20_41_14]